MHATCLTPFLRALVLAFLGPAFAAPLAAQTTWHVPGDVPTIQGAIAAASNGDTIAIAPGTYHEVLDSAGKSVTIVGLGGAAATIVDGTGLGTSVLRLAFQTGGNGVHAQGLTLTGGTGVPDPPSGFKGGGVYAGSGNHVLQHCIIRNNSVAGSFGTGGGAWAGSNGLDSGQITLEDCELAFNSAGANGGGAAGVVFLLRCRVHDNSAGALGGGLNLPRSVQECVLESNTAGGNGGGIAYNTNSNLVAELDDCVFRGNQANFGGGLFVNGTVALAGNRFEGNSAAIAGGGAYMTAGNPTLGLTVDRCLFAGNSAPNGDGLAVGAGTLIFPTLMYEASRCTFVGDQVWNAAAQWPGKLVLRNAIFRGHPQPIAFAPTLQQVLYCDVEGGAAGTGNIDADPLFVDAAGGDYALQAGSPCIDAGDPSSAADPDGSVADMGAIPLFHGWLDLGGAIAGTAGAPHLDGTGLLAAGQPIAVELTGAAPLASTLLVLGFTSLGVPFKGGTLWPTLDIVIGGLPTNSIGAWTLGTTWPTGVPSGFNLFLQVWFADGGAVHGLAASNGLRATTP